MVEQTDAFVLDGRYRLESVLGRGAWATVYLAEQESVAREVAVKVLKPEACTTSEIVSRTLREARLVAGLNHPNIVSVYDFGSFDDRPYIVMELVSGPSLGRMLKGGRHLDPEQALPIFAQIARGLACAHAAGIVHRDIKPANILVETRPDGPVVAKVTDFGVATTVASDLTQAGAVIGTPAYMAPEQARGLTVDARADLYSLGAVMFRALTGRRPFTGEDALAMAVAHLTQPIPTFAEVAPELAIPRRLEGIVRRLLAKDPGDRYPSAEALLQDLEAPDDSPLSGLDPESCEGTLEAPYASVGRRDLRWVAGGAIALVLLGLVGIATFFPRPAEPEHVPVPVPVPVVEVAPAPPPPVVVEEEPAPAEPQPERPLPGVPVAFEGDALRVWLVDPEGRRTSLPARVAPAVYRVVALFPSSEPTTAGHVRIEGATTLRCVSFAMRCKPNG